MHSSKGLSYHDLNKTIIIFREYLQHGCTLTPTLVNVSNVNIYAEVTLMSGITQMGTMTETAVFST